MCVCACVCVCVCVCLHVRKARKKDLSNPAVFFNQCVSQKTTVSSPVDLYDKLNKQQTIMKKKGSLAIYNEVFFDIMAQLALHPVEKHLVDNSSTINQMYLNGFSKTFRRLLTERAALHDIQWNDTGAVMSYVDRMWTNNEDSRYDDSPKDFLRVLKFPGV